MQTSTIPSGSNAQATQVSWSMVGTLAFCLFCCVPFWFFMVAFYAPSLIQDHRLAHTYKIDQNLTVENASCDNMKYLIQLCAIDMVSTKEGRATKRFMTSFSTPGTTRAMRSTTNPAAIADTYSIDRITNRTLTFLAIFAAFAAFTGFLLVGIAKGLYRLLINPSH